MMSFIGNACNSTPGVGHVKGLIHYVCNDKEAGDRAMRLATRTSAVLGAAAAGALAGPVGAIAAGAAAGVCYDTGVAVVTDGKHVSGVAKILEKPGEISSWVGAGIDVVGDGCCGVGAGLGNVAKETAKTVAKQTTKEVLKQETKIIAKSFVFDVARITLQKGAEILDSELGRCRAESDQLNQDHPVEQQFVIIVGRIEWLIERLKNMSDKPNFHKMISKLFQQLILAAIPLMDDPIIRLTINNELLKIVTASISCQQGDFLSRAIRHVISNSCSIRQPCNRSSCRFCPNLRELQSNHDWTENCETRGVTYCFYCKECHCIVYAGQTTQPLRDRMTHHLNFKKSPLRRHIANNPAGHWNGRNGRNLLNIFDVIIMWTTNDVDSDLDDSNMSHIIRNWETFSLWLNQVHRHSQTE